MCNLQNAPKQHLRWTMARECIYWELYSVSLPRSFLTFPYLATGTKASATFQFFHQMLVFAKVNVRQEKLLPAFSTLHSSSSWIFMISKEMASTRGAKKEGSIVEISVRELQITPNLIEIDCPTLTHLMVSSRSHLVCLLCTPWMPKGSFLGKAKKGRKKGKIRAADGFLYPFSLHPNELLPPRSCFSSYTGTWKECFHYFQNFWQLL